MPKAKTAKESAKEWDEISRYAKQRGESQKKIDSYKKYARKDRADAKKYSKKSKKIESYHRSMAGDKTYDLVKSKRTSTLVGESYILGTYGAFKYNQALAAGKSRGKSFISGVGHTYLNAFTGGAASVVGPRLDRKSRSKK